MNLSERQKDALKEIINIGVGRAAGILNEMLNAHVQLMVPEIRIFHQKDLEENIANFVESRLSIIRMIFKGPFSGVASLIFPSASASNLLTLLVENANESVDLNSIRIGTLTEVGNIILNGVMGTIGNLLNRQISYSLPNYHEDTIIKFLKSNTSMSSTIIMIAHTHLKVKTHMVEGDIILFFEVSSFDALIGAATDSFEKKHR